VRDWVVQTSVSIYTVLLPIAWIVLAIAVLVLIPLAVWPRTRAAAAVGLFISSYVFGATTWFLGAAITFGSFGWFGLIVGLFFLGLGVVPLGIIGAYFKLDLGGLAVSLFVMLFITFAARFGGTLLATRAQDGSATR
jgi:hypothetical protein